MTDQEIQSEIDKVQFPAPREHEVVVNLPLTIPKALFMEQIEAFARSRGWQAEEIHNPDMDIMSALLYLATIYRNDIRSEFEVFIRQQAVKQAEAQADQIINQTFGG
jgi:hypothetical protein